MAQKSLHTFFTRTPRGKHLSRLSAISPPETSSQSSLTLDGAAFTLSPTGELDCSYSRSHGSRPAGRTYSVLEEKERSCISAEDCLGLKEGGSVKRKRCRAEADELEVSDVIQTVPEKRHRSSLTEEGEKQAVLPGRGGSSEAEVALPRLDPAKRKRFREAVGEEDFEAAGKQGAWAEARKNIDWLKPSKVRDANGRRPGEAGYDKRTVTVPPHILAEKSKSQMQYWITKSQYMDTVLFFKVGKFYELYELDAEIGHKELGWKLTVSGVGKCLQVGVPESGIDDAVAKLVARGYKVGRMEQVETGAEARKRGPKEMVGRKLTQVMSAATIIDGAIQPEAVHLLALKELALRGTMTPSEGCQPQAVSTDGGAVLFAFAFLDAAAGKFYVGTVPDDSSRAALQALLMQVSPQEVLFELGGTTAETRRTLRTSRGPEFLDPSTAVQELEEQGYFQPTGQLSSRNAGKGLLSVLSEVGRDGDPGLAASALGALVSHLRRLKVGNELLPHGELLPYSVYSGSLRLDGQTLRNLELLENMEDGGKAGTLFGHLDSCHTPAGKRLLRRWICHPLCSIPAIEARLDAVDELMVRRVMVASLASGLRKLPDLERLVGRMRGMGGSATLGFVPMAAGQSHRKRLKVFSQSIKGMLDACALLHDLKCGLDGDGQPKSALLLAAAHAADDAAAMEALKACNELICWPRSKNESLQLHIELESSPDKDESQSADQRMLQEASLLAELLKRFSQHSLAWAAITEALARTDVLIAIAAASNASGGPTCRPKLVTRVEGKLGAKSRKPSPGGAALSADLGPEVSSGAKLSAYGLWHPYAIGGGGGAVVPNDLMLGGTESTGSGAEDGCKDVVAHNTHSAPRAMLLTGPNMGGKSTLLRATCLAVLMAQLGCHVPATDFTLSPVDTIFTRLGASDRIMAGESTFMVECNEAASVLRHATIDSFVVLDELGRGTSTFDGYAIAYAVLKHLTDNVDCRLLFATHYHPLTAEFAAHPSVSLRYMGFIFKQSCVSNWSQQTAAGADGCSLTDARSAHGLLGQDFNGDKEKRGVLNASRKSVKLVPPAAGDQLTFLYKLQEGACPKSCGLQVASLAGIFPSVVTRAADAAEGLLEQLEDKFDAAIYGGGSLDIHNNWVQGISCAVQTLESFETGAGSQEDAFDALTCIWTEIRKSSI